MKKLNTFNLVAPWYDALTTLVFGNEILDAQLANLSIIRTEARVLVLGGGSGKFLKELYALRPGVEVWYIEASSRMLTQAKRNTPKGMNIHFIHGTEESIPGGAGFDAVLLFFYLDMFPPDELQTCIRRIRRHVSPQAMWLIADFVQERWWHIWLLSMMFAFFFVTAGLRLFRLSRWPVLLQKAGLTCESSATRFGGFIRSSHFTTTP